MTDVNFVYLLIITMIIGGLAYIQLANSEERETYRNACIQEGHSVEDCLRIFP